MTMTKPLSRSAVRIYGALLALGDGSADVLTRLLPFFEPILREGRGQIFDPEEFAADVRTSYKWNFNVDIVEVFVPRLEEVGWLTPMDLENSTQTFMISIPEEIPETENEKNASEELRDIAYRFQKFARDLSPLTSIPREVEEYEDMLIEWLIFIEAFSEDSIEFTTTVQEDASGTMRQIVGIPNTTTLQDEQKFLCARFVQHELQQDGTSAETLVRIASIGLLTEVVQDFVRPADAVHTTDLVVYLDAPIALELLGVSGRAARANTVPVVEELQRIGAKTRIFSQSLEEMKLALKAVLENPRPTGPTAQALARRDVLREFVSQVSLDPTPFLEKQGISVAHRKIEQTPSEHKYFTAEQRQEIFAVQTFQRNIRARDHDADITTFTMRQRRGKFNRDIFESNYLVVTRNGLLAQVVRKACIEMDLLSKTEIPPVVHRRVLAAAMWLRTGLGSNKLEVPKRILLANCEQVLAVRKGVVEAVKNLTDSLEDEEKVRQLDLLITQDRSTQMLMDKTLGATSVITEENLSFLFSEMLHPYLEEEREKGKAEIREEKKRGTEREKRLKDELNAVKEEIRDASKQLQADMVSDREAVAALCKDVAQRLASVRVRRKWFAGALAGLSCLPLFLDTSMFSIGLAAGIAGILAYLTITNSSLIGIVTLEDNALAALRTEAKRRMLEAKLDKFSVRWEGQSFKIQSTNFLLDSDLLTPLKDNREIGA